MNILENFPHWRINLTSGIQFMMLNVFPSLYMERILILWLCMTVARR